MDQRSGGDQRGQRGIDPDMADPLDRPRHQERAGEEADIVAGHDQPADGFREAFELGPHAEQGTCC